MGVIVWKLLARVVLILRGSAHNLVHESGRLDVCKSGVCGAGLNRNME